MLFIETLRGFAEGVKRNVGSNGVVVGCLILVLIALLLVPIPKQMLDVLLVVNFVVALVLLLMGLFVSESKQLFSFPSVLLLSTLFRLGLNVSSTRLILLNGDRGLDAAGQMIESFGSLVVQRDFVVGAIIFGIIAIVNFVVIAKGSARVAEVAARFTLDALPGKQLAIDSDFRSGNLSKEEAVNLRDELVTESQFYGSMDGAMRFVQGDAIAGFIITFINAVGGISIGLTREMGFIEAVDTFGVLTIGDGLVSIVPSLLISVCAGIVVTRVSGNASTSTSSDISQQFFAQPQAIATAASVLILLSIVPGLPIFPLAGVGGGMLFWLFFSGSFVKGRDKEGASVVNLVSSALSSAPWSSLPENVISRIGGVDQAISVDANKVKLLDAGLSSQSILGLCVEIDYKGLSLYLEESNGENLKGFYSYAAKLRSQFYRSRGVILPEIGISSMRELENGKFAVLVRERPCRFGEIDVEAVFVSAGASVLDMLGIRVLSTTSHPLSNCSACWVEKDSVGLNSLERLGVELLKPYQYLALQAIGAANEVIEELFGLAEVKTLLGNSESSNSDNNSEELVKELFDGGVISIAEFTDVLRRLVRERVNIRDLKLIQEGIVEYSSGNQDVEDRALWLSGVHTFLRWILRRGIIADSVSKTGKLRTFLLSDEVEQEFRDLNTGADNAKTLPPLDPSTARVLRLCANTLFRPLLERGTTPVVVLCSADIRSSVDEFFSNREGSREWFRTLAFEELGGNLMPESVGVIGLS